MSEMNEVPQGTKNDPAGKKSEKLSIKEKFIT